MMKHNDFLRAAAALTVTLGLAAAPHAVSAQEASPFDARQSEAIERLGLPWVGHPVAWVRATNDPNRVIPIAIGTDPSVNLARNIYQLGRASWRERVCQ